MLISRRLAWLCSLAALWLLCDPERCAACDIPVYRFALERWQSDPYEVILFHRGVLEPEDERILAGLEEIATQNGGSCNLEVRRVDLREPLRPDLQAVWDSEKQAQAPWVVINRPFRRGSPSVLVWRGKPRELDVASLTGSPLRDELQHRLLRGDSVVWLFFGSGSADQDRACLDRLEKKLKQLEDEIPVPAGVGLPGSELYSDVPLKTRFSVLQVSAGDNREEMLIAMLKPSDSKGVAAGPWAVPVYGRARALEVLSAERLTESLIEDISYYLSEGCSCQVKAQNPGFDLLLTARWDKLLFGAGQVPEVLPASPAAEVPPTYVPIPPGNPRRGAPR